MASDIFDFTIENRFEESTTGEEIALQVIPLHGIGHGSTVMPNTQAKQFSFTSSDGYIIFKIKCLNHEIGKSDYITVDTNHKVQLSITNKCWKMKISRKQSTGYHQDSPINIQVGRGE